MLYAENKVATDELQRNEYIFWGAALICLVVFTGCDAWWGHEAFFAEAVREMVTQSNCLIPVFNREIVYNVPVPLLWEGVLAGKLFGVSEWTLRLVVALNGGVLLAGTVALGKLFFSRRVALFAGVLLLGCGAFLYLSRLFLDAIPAAACGVWAVYILLSGKKKNTFRPVAFMSLLLLATLFGTFYAALPPLVTAIILSFAGNSDAPRRKPKWLAWSLSVIGFGAAAYLLRNYGVLPPDLSAVAEKWMRHGVRAVCFDGLRIVFPWSLWGISVMIRNLGAIRKQEKNFRFFTLAVLAVWLISLIPAAENWRRMIFLAPVLTILMAATLSEEDSLGKTEIAVDTLVRYLAMVTGAVAVASVIVIPIWKALFKLDMPNSVLFAVPAAGLLAQIFLLFDRAAAARFALPKRCGGTVLAALTLTAAAICVIRPNLAGFRSGREFILNHLQSPLKNLPESAILYYGEKPDAAVLFYSNTDRRLRCSGKEERIRALREFLTRNNEGFVAVIADADAAQQMEIATVAADFSLWWDSPSAQEKLPAFRNHEKRLTLYYGNTVVKKEENSTSNKEE
ncbi:MAG: glycosyltransferase family 39 protein [Victivallaceae bacterium]|nr:glycosyltransferase family 39 protein [Victivallaceae bacterium]